MSVPATAITKLARNDSDSEAEAVAQHATLTAGGRADVELPLLDAERVALASAPLLEARTTRNNHLDMPSKIA